MSPYYGHHNFWEHENRDGTDPPEDDGERTCDHGRLMTEPCDECEPPETGAVVVHDRRKNDIAMADTFNLRRR